MVVNVKLSKKIRFKVTVCITCVVLTSCSSLKTPVRPELNPVQATTTAEEHLQIAKSRYKIDKKVWEYFLEKPYSDSTELERATHFQLQFTGKKNVVIRLFNGGQILKTHRLSGKYKDGYFRLKHRLKYSGIPPLFWSLDSQKTQLGFGLHQELFIDHSYSRNGGIIFFMAGTPDVTLSTTVPLYHP